MTDILIGEFRVWKASWRLPTARPAGTHEVEPRPGCVAHPQRDLRNQPTQRFFTSSIVTTGGFTPSLTSVTM